MKKVILSAMVVMATVTAINVLSFSEKNEFSNIIQSGVEALTNDESGGGSFGCGYAAYQYKDTSIFGNVNFVRCRDGCPDQKGRDPWYMQC